MLTLSLSIIWTARAQSPVNYPYKNASVSGGVQAAEFGLGVSPLVADDTCNSGQYWIAPVLGSTNAWRQCTNGTLSTFGGGGISGLTPNTYPIAATSSTLTNGTISTSAGTDTDSNNFASTGTITSAKAITTTAGLDGIWNNGSVGVWAGSNQIFGSGSPTVGAGVVSLIVPQHNTAVGHASAYVSTGSTGEALYVCIYTSTTTANVWNTSIAATGTATAASGSASQYVLQAGVPYYVLLSQQGNASGAVFQTWSYNANALAIMSTQSSATVQWFGTAANGVSSTSCPATVGNITGATGVFPAVFLGP